ncbi:MAG: imidazole glycerol phosphate synthase subunit HisH [Chloroflexi bacterium]|nr:MAG: imidazole glycerol phosphate synthase, glutamine amidotransferase subunit [Actinobacteria bacterium 13_1_40CM_66_12]TMF43233.1 MAG: imidazole glycerol phosphate synthase subunit HisH [Chloroflexota bacterium]
MIVIVDYGVGNLRSVERALLQVGAKSKLTADQDELQQADGMVLPGVGAFGPALAKLSEGGLGRRVVELANKGKPVLGVCLGYQLLFEESMEHGRHEGLGLLDGRVVEVTQAEHVPVIGWCRLAQTEVSPLWQGIPDRAYFYFVHSYTPDASRHAIASTEQSPAAAAARRNVMGTQFHPEKSGANGLRVYENFVSLCG